VRGTIPRAIGGAAAAGFVALGTLHYSPLPEVPAALTGLALGGLAALLFIRHEVRLLMHL
jgi:hypothetical protein